MTDDELDALLATAKPVASQFEAGCWWFVNGCPVLTAVIPSDVFDLLGGGTPTTLSLRYDTETAATDALRAAVAKYKEARP